MHTVIATLKFNSDESKEKFLEILKSENGVAKTRQFDGCISIQCLEVTDEKNTVVIYQQWREQGCHEKYMEFRKEEGLLAQISETFEEPMEIVHLDYISA